MPSKVLTLIASAYSTIIAWSVIYFQWRCLNASRPAESKERTAVRPRLDWRKLVRCLAKSVFVEEPENRAIAASALQNK